MCLLASCQMWATPGPYLRKSMNNTTFDESDGAPSRSKEEEETLALSLSVRLKTDIEAKNDDSEPDDEN